MAVLLFMLLTSLLSLSAVMDELEALAGTSSFGAEMITLVRTASFAELAAHLNYRATRVEYPRW